MLAGTIEPDGADNEPLNGVIAWSGFQNFQYCVIKQRDNQKLELVIRHSLIS